MGLLLFGHLEGLQDWYIGIPGLEANLRKAGAILQVLTRDEAGRFG